MKYVANGKRSKAWWLQAVKWFGDQGTPGIMRGVEVATHHVKFATEDLALLGLVERKGGGQRQQAHFQFNGSRFALSRGASG